MNPFYHPAQPHQWTALTHHRGGYVQLAANALDQHQLAHVPDTLFAVALDWAKRLEVLGAIRVYWFCLSEEQPHYHWHLYPRWSAEEAKGWPLFAQRFDEPNTWTPALTNQLTLWAATHRVYVVNP